MSAGDRLRTARLVLRELTVDDVDFLVGLDADPEVMRFLTGGKPTPREQINRDVVSNTMQYQQFPGLGRWLTVLGDTGEPVGWLSLAPADDRRQAELGYRLRRAYWHQGLAAEGARALVDDAFENRLVARVFAQTMVVNAPSRAVMERAGLCYVRTFHEHFDDPIPGTELGEVEYAVTREQWCGRRDSGSCGQRVLP